MTSTSAITPATASPRLDPGDEAPAGTPGTGETVCPRCGGTGKIDGSTGNNAGCPECGGSGKITIGIGGG